MPRKEFVPIVPAGFDIAGSFSGVTTAVGVGGVPRIRYQVLPGVSFPTKGLIGFATRQVMKGGLGDEVAIGSLHTRMMGALMLIGVQPEIGIIERLETNPMTALILGRYLDRKTEAQRFGAMGLVKSAPGMIEIFVTECDSEAGARVLIDAAIAPYL